MVDLASLSLLWHPLGACVGSHTQVADCQSYNFWSGIGSDVGELTLLGIFFTALRHINCHVPWCFRFGKHPVNGTPFKVCRRHHPDVPTRRLKLAHIEDAHQKAQRRPDRERGDRDIGTTTDSTW